MKFVIGLVCGVLLGVIFGKYYLFNSNPVHNEATITKEHQIYSLESTDRLSDATKQNSQKSSVTTKNQELCQPRLTEASTILQQDSSFTEVDVAHPIFGEDPMDVDVIAENFQKEIPDHQWHFYLAPKVNDFFRQHTLDGAYKEHHLDCRSTACKLEAKFKLNSKDPSEMMKMHSMMRKRGLVGPLASSYSHCDENFICAYTEYFSRDPLNDPYMTTIPWRRTPKGN